MVFNTCLSHPSTLCNLVYDFSCGSFDGTIFCLYCSLSLSSLPLCIIHLSSYNIQINSFGWHYIHVARMVDGAIFVLSLFGCRFSAWLSLPLLCSLFLQTVYKREKHIVYPSYLVCFSHKRAAEVSGRISAVLCALEKYPTCQGGYTHHLCARKDISDPLP